MNISSQYAMKFSSSASFCLLDPCSGSWLSVCINTALAVRLFTNWVSYANRFHRLQTLPHFASVDLGSHLKMSRMVSSERSMKWSAGNPISNCELANWLMQAKHTLAIWNLLLVTLVQGELLYCGGLNGCSRPATTMPLLSLQEIKGNMLN